MGASGWGDVSRLLLATTPWTGLPLRPNGGAKTHLQGGICQEGRQVCLPARPEGHQMTWFRMSDTGVALEESEVLLAVCP